MVDFNYDSMDAAEIIADRAEEMGFKPAGDDRMGFLMDVMAANGVNGNPTLDFAKLMQFDDASFGHDIAGIYRHLDRSTGQITDCFLPRCAA